MDFYSYQYLVNHTNDLNNAVIAVIIVLLAVAVILLILLLKKKIAVRYKEISILLFVLVALMTGVQISNAITQQDVASQYKSNVSTIRRAFHAPAYPAGRDIDKHPYHNRGYHLQSQR